VTVEQVAQVNLNFTEADILVHAYLMYGFPTQTIQETVDSLEMVRQLFELGIINSGFWHQFSLTTHSPINLNTEEYGIIPNYKEITFANNDIDFKDKTGIEHDKFSYGLKKSIFNFMHGIGFDIELQEWFDFNIPTTTIQPHFIEDCLNSEENLTTKSSAKIVWLGGEPLISYVEKTKRGKTKEYIQLAFHTKNELFETSIEKEKGEWLLDMLEKIAVQQKEVFTFTQLKENFEQNFENFELFWYSKPLKKLRNHGLLVL
jgi:hypothetical protein